MKSYYDLKVEIEAIQQQKVGVKKNVGANALKEVKRLFKEFGFTAGILKSSLAEGRKRQ
jgi:hypothetical protein